MDLSSWNDFSCSSEVMDFGIILSFTKFFLISPDSRSYNSLVMGLDPAVLRVKSKPQSSHVLMAVALP